VNAEFNWWLLLVGLVIGAGLAWVVLEDRRGSAGDVAADEEDLEAEASWIAAQLSDNGRSVDPDLAAEVLRLHAEYADADGWTPPTRATATVETIDRPRMQAAKPQTAPEERSGASESHEGATRI
jgi:hypothetical protein